MAEPNRPEPLSVAELVATAEAIATKAHAGQLCRKWALLTMSVVAD